MKKYLILLIALSTLVQCTDIDAPTGETAAMQPQFIFLVRHAEKSLEDPEDPELTEAGMARAEKLAGILAEAEIAHVFSTNFKRTRDTARPLADLTGNDLEIYDPNDETFLAKLKTANGNILVVGHSNSTPSLVNKLLGSEKYQSLDESEYGTIFVLSRGSQGYNSTILGY